MFAHLLDDISYAAGRLATDPAGTETTVSSVDKSGMRQPSQEGERRGGGGNHFNLVTFLLLPEFSDEAAVD